LSQTSDHIGVICAQDNINQTTSYLCALEKQLSQYQKYLLLRFANSRSRMLHSLEELTCGLCDNVLIIGARFPINIDWPDVVLIDCLESDGANRIQFDHTLAAETVCNYLISQVWCQIVLTHPQGSGFAGQALLARYSCPLFLLFRRLNIQWTR
jgi:DNA-binding LacI/PurR family transcriptional regulator